MRSLRCLQRRKTREELGGERYAVLADWYRPARKKREPLTRSALSSSWSLRLCAYARFTAGATILRVAPQAVRLGALSACTPVGAGRPPPCCGATRRLLLAAVVGLLEDVPGHLPAPDPKRYRRRQC